MNLRRGFRGTLGRKGMLELSGDEYLVPREEDAEDVRERILKTLVL